MQPELGSLLGEILFIKTSEGKLEEINVSTQITKNFNASSSAGSHLFFHLSRWIQISAIGSFEGGSWQEYINDFFRKAVCYIRWWWGRPWWNITIKLVGYMTWKAQRVTPAFSSLSWTEKNSKKHALLTAIYCVTLSILSFSCSRHLVLHLFVLQHGPCITSFCLLSLEDAFYF